MHDAMQEGSAPATPWDFAGGVGGGEEGTVKGGGEDGSGGEGGDPYSSLMYVSSLVKLYNDLGLRLMDKRDHAGALSMLRKAEALLASDAAWPVDGGAPATPPAAAVLNGEHAGEAQQAGPRETAGQKRSRLQFITFNNLGCLHKRAGAPQEALGYLTAALAEGKTSGRQPDAASTHLNVCAALSALRRYREALGHAERAVVLLQRQLWGGHAASFHDGVLYLGRLGPTKGAVPVGAGSFAAGSGGGIGGTDGVLDKQTLGTLSVLAMAYHNTAVESERLGKVKEAQVSFARACTLAQKFLSPKAPTTAALLRAQRAFVARQRAVAAGGHNHGAAGAAVGLKKATAAVRQATVKRPGVLGSGVSARAGVIARPAGRGGMVTSSSRQSLASSVASSSRAAVAGKLPEARR
jgi:tetratricopeptide (TPR) repeat protein